MLSRTKITKKSKMSSNKEIKKKDLEDLLAIVRKRIAKRIFEKIEKYQAKEDKTIFSNPHLKVYRKKGTIFITSKQWREIKDEVSKGE